MTVPLPLVDQNRNNKTLIYIEIKGEDLDRVFLCKVKIDVPMGVLKTKFMNAIGLDSRFDLFLNEQAIPDHATARSLRLREHEVIELQAII